MKMYKLVVMGLFGSSRAIYYETKDEIYSGWAMIKRLGGYALVQKLDPDQGTYRTICGG